MRLMINVTRNCLLIGMYFFLAATTIMCDSTVKKDKSSISPASRDDSPGVPGKVEIVKQGNSFQLIRNGKPYFIKGVAGEQQVEVAAAAGANSIRTYTADDLDNLLNKADSLGLSVMVGIWLGREIEGFDYDDVAAVEKQKGMVKSIINQYKNHPAVLCWTLGNELDNLTNKKAGLWAAMNDLVDLAHELDPNHPVTTAITTTNYQDVKRNCPRLDFLSINAFGNMAEFHDKIANDAPFIYSEWGPLGPWESDKTYWHAVLEQSIKQKYDYIQQQYSKYIAPDTTRCLGSYVFYWGQKQEFTPTWFSFFTENGLKTPLVDAMTTLWNGNSTENKAPFIDSLMLDEKIVLQSLEIDFNKTHTASIRAIDQEGDDLEFSWEIIPDGPFFEYLPNRGKVEIRPKAIDNLIIKQSGNAIEFRSPPEPGAYRLLVYAYDGKGNGSYANMPFFLTNKNLVD